MLWLASERVNKRKIVFFSPEAIFLYGKMIYLLPGHVFFIFSGCRGVSFGDGFLPGLLEFPPDPAA